MFAPSSLDTFEPSKRRQVCLAGCEQATRLAVRWSLSWSGAWLSLLGAAAFTAFRVRVGAVATNVGAQTLSAGAVVAGGATDDVVVGGAALHCLCGAHTVCQRGKHVHVDLIGPLARAVERMAFKHVCMSLF